MLDMPPAMIKVVGIDVGRRLGLNVNYVHKLVIRNHTKPIAEACERGSDFALKNKGTQGGGDKYQTS